LFSPIVGIAHDINAVLVNGSMLAGKEGEQLVRSLKDEFDKVIFLGDEIYIPTRTIYGVNSQAIRTRKYRPLVSGISVGNALITAGTLGWFATVGGDILGLTNAHVVHDDPRSPNPPKSLAILQPGAYDGGTIADSLAGYYYAHTPIATINESNCPVANGVAGMLNIISRVLGRKSRFATYVDTVNDADVGLFRLNDKAVYQVLADNGLLINPPGKFAGLLFGGGNGVYVATKASVIQQHFPNIKIVGEVKDVSLGSKVVKFGRTTGMSEGQVISTNATIRVVGYGGTGVAIFTNVFVVQANSAGGDSGSAVWLVE